MNADQEPRSRSGSAAEPATNRDRSDARPEETELSDRLTDIADHHVPVPDWSDVVHRADSPPAIPLRPSVAAGGRRPLGRTAMAVAAALIVVVGAVGVYVTTRDDDGDPLETGPAGPDDAEVIDTGWYIPSPMPDGWEVTAVETSTMNLVGPGRLAVWAAPDGSASLVHASEPADDALPLEDAAHLQLTGEISGRVLDDDAAGYPGAVVWQHLDQSHTVIGLGLDPDDVKHAARQLAADPTLTSSPVDGLVSVERTVRGYAKREVTDVTVAVRTSAGRELRYQLGPDDGMSRSMMLTATPVARQIEGQPLEVLDLLPRPGYERVSSTYLGRWPGADVSLPVLTYEQMTAGSQAHPSQEEVDTLLRSLRPATSDAWRSFLRDSGSQVDDRLLTAGRLADLSGEPAGSGTTATAPMGEDDVVPARERIEAWRDDQLALFDTIPAPWGWSGPHFGDTSVPSGTPISVEVLFRYSGAQALRLNECTIAAVTIGLVPAGSDELVPRPDITGCDPTVTALTVEPTSDDPALTEWTSWPVPEPYTGGVPTREILDGPDGAYLGGTLPPGRYDIVLSTVTTAGISTAQAVEVLPHPCGGFTTQFVDRFIGRSVDEAADEAAAVGFTTRVTDIEGVEQGVTDDHRCDRVNLSVSGGLVVGVEDVG